MAKEQELGWTAADIRSQFAQGTGARPLMPPSSQQPSQAELILLFQWTWYPMHMQPRLRAESSGTPLDQRPASRARGGSQQSSALKSGRTGFRMFRINANDHGLLELCPIRPGSFPGLRTCCEMRLEWSSRCARRVFRRADARDKQRTSQAEKHRAPSSRT